jgi:hypothetical protein
MNTIMMTTTSLLAGAALVLGGAVAANAATPAPSPKPSSSSSCTLGEHLVSAWLAIPKTMRADLKAARADAPGTARRTAVKAVATKALDGGYGQSVEEKAKWLQSHKGDGIRPLPDSLKADLKTLHSDTGTTAKLAEINTIASNALSGKYGDTVQTLVKAAQSSSAWQDCSPLVSSGSGTAS